MVIAYRPKLKMVNIVVNSGTAIRQNSRAATAYIDHRVALERQRRVRQVHIPSEWSDHQIDFQDGPLAGQQAQVTAAALATVTGTPNTTPGAAG